MKFKKILALLCISASIVMALSGCFASEEAPTEPMENENVQSLQ